MLLSKSLDMHARTELYFKSSIQVQFTALNSEVNSISVHLAKTKFELLLNSPYNFFSSVQKSFAREFSCSSSSVFVQIIKLELTTDFVEKT